MLFLSVLSLGFLHGLGADHLMAIAALSVTAPAMGPSRYSHSFWLAVRFGAGHALFLTLGTVAVLLLGWQLPLWLERAGEVTGGWLLILLGGIGGWLTVTGRVYAHSHAHAHGPHDQDDQTGAGFITAQGASRVWWHRASAVSPPGLQSKTRPTYVGRVLFFGPAAGRTEVLRHLRGGCETGADDPHHRHWHIHVGRRHEHHARSIHTALPGVLGAVFAVSGLRALILALPLWGTPQEIGNVISLVAVFAIGILASMSLFGIVLAHALDARQMSVQAARFAAGATALGSLALGTYWIQ